MARKSTTSANAVNTTPVAENDSAISLFTPSYLNIKNLHHKEFKNSVVLTNVLGDSQSLSFEQYDAFCEQLSLEKAFAIQLQKPYNGDYQGKISDKPDIRIRGNMYFEEGFVLIDVLQSKNGHTVIASPADVHRRMYFKIDEDILYTYWNVVINEREASATIKKLALERSISNGGCLAL